ncbi:MAG: hypothetical protein E3J91_02595 [Hadesarchaea archaeon]|nr:MAG: hypothetical protein E3J91_02595 [Hadesarchaea archaeon]
MLSSLKRIAYELKRHAPFTALGAFTGIILMGIAILIGLSSESSHTIFHVLHPAHIVLSALVTTAIYRRYGGGIGAAVGIGFVGSIAICSVSDIVFPYLGGVLLEFPITFHVCFIEDTWLIIPSVLAGITIGLLWPHTRFPHAGHVLLSTYASLFYFATFGAPADWAPLLPLVFPILFVAVWIPCCVSDVVFPLLFVRKKKHR